VPHLHSRFLATTTKNRLVRMPHDQRSRRGLADSLSDSGANKHAGRGAALPGVPLRKTLVLSVTGS
jgi:hypothetical protein